MSNNTFHRIQIDVCDKLLAFLAAVLVILIPILTARIFETGFEPVMILHLLVAMITWVFWFGRHSIGMRVKFSWLILFFILIDISATFRNENIYVGNSCFILAIICGSLVFNKVVLMGLAGLQCVFTTSYIYWHSGLVIEAISHGLATPLLAYVAMLATLHLRESLLRSLEAAEYADQVKSQFLANMSHEMRTPLNSVIGLLQLLQIEKLPIPAQDYIKRAYHSSGHLLSIINNILDYSKIEEGELELEEADFNLSETFKFIQDVMSAQADQKNLAFSVVLNSDCPAVVRGDRTRLTQVVLNLLSNAIKFTEQGQVECKLSVAHLTEKQEVVDLLFEVNDTGIGIPTEQQSVIFQRFHQADSSHTRKYGGTGLGLAISCQLVHQMGGKLQMTSEVGKGSRFYFVLPFEIVQMAEPGVEPLASIALETSASKSLENLLVLVADDSEPNRFVTVALLQKLGVTAISVEDGQEAIEAMRETERPFDIVLMDMQMPVMDGVEATRLLRQHYGFSHVPIIALTANTQPHHVQSCFDVGMNDFMEKPLQIDRLEAMLLKHYPSP